MAYSNKSSWGRLWLTLFFTLNESLHNPQFWESGVAQNISTAQSPLSRCESASEIFITVPGLSQDNDSINTSLWYLCRASIYLFIYLLLYLAPWLGPGCLCLGRKGKQENDSSVRQEGFRLRFKKYCHSYLHRWQSQPSSPDELGKH